jgi:thiol:disulfide interchange protein
MISKLIKKSAIIISFIFTASQCAPGFEIKGAIPKSSSEEMVKVTGLNQFETISPGLKPAIALQFEVKEGWHFYSDANSAPGGKNLQISSKADWSLFKFGDPIIPKGEPYEDKLSGTKTDVIGGSFVVYVPYELSPLSSFAGDTIMHFDIEGALCSSEQCRMTKIPVDVNVTVSNKPAGSAKFQLPGADTKPVKDSMAQYSTFAALLLAFAAGLILNIMPCVLPVIPLKVLNIFEHSKQSKKKCILLGLAFCAGILVFFSLIAIANIVLRGFYGSTL